MNRTQIIDRILKLKEKASGSNHLNDEALANEQKAAQGLADELIKRHNVTAGELDAYNQDDDVDDDDDDFIDDDAYTDAVKQNAQWFSGFGGFGGRYSNQYVGATHWFSTATGTWTAAPPQQDRLVEDLGGYGRVEAWPIRTPSAGGSIQREGVRLNFHLAGAVSIQIGVQFLAGSPMKFRWTGGDRRAAAFAEALNILILTSLWAKVTRWHCNGLVGAPMVAFPPGCPVRTEAMW